LVCFWLLVLSTAPRISQTLDLIAFPSAYNCFGHLFSVRAIFIENLYTIYANLYLGLGLSCSQNRLVILLRKIISKRQQNHYPGSVDDLQIQFMFRKSLQKSLQTTNTSAGSFLKADISELGKLVYWLHQRPVVKPSSNPFWHISSNVPTIYWHQLHLLFRYNIQGS
jgi:hypothetical protein